MIRYTLIYLVDTVLVGLFKNNMQMTAILKWYFVLIILVCITKCSIDHKCIYYFICLQYIHNKRDTTTLFSFTRSFIYKNHLFPFMIYRPTLIRRDRVPPYKESLEYVVSEECDMNLLISVECTKDRKTFSMRLKWLRKWEKSV